MKCTIGAKWTALLIAKIKDSVYVQSKTYFIMPWKHKCHGIHQQPKIYDQELPHTWICQDPSRFKKKTHILKNAKIHLTELNAPTINLISFCFLPLQILRFYLNQLSWAQKQILSNSCVLGHLYQIGLI